MVRAAYFDINGTKKGAWSEEEDNKLRAYFQRRSHVPNWRLLPIIAGLARSGKSCRLRWVNYLKPGLKRGKFDKYDTDLIIKLHSKFGNKWSAIAAKLPGRSDNEIKNFWHAHIKKHIRENRADQRLLPEEQSHEINIAKTEENDSKNVVGILSVENNQSLNGFNFPNEDSYSVAESQDDLSSEVSEACFSEIFPEELPYSGLDCQMHALDYGIITSWYPIADQSLLDEEDTFDVVLWQY